MKMESAMGNTHRVIAETDRSESEMNLNKIYRTIPFERKILDSKVEISNFENADEIKIAFADLSNVDIDDKTEDLKNEKHFSLKVVQNVYRMRAKILLMELQVIAESIRTSKKTLQGSSGNIEARQLIQPFKAIEELINDTDICLKNSELAFNIGDLEIAFQHLGIAEEKFSQLKANLQSNTEGEKRSSKTRKNVCIENSPSEILDNNVDIEDKTEDLKNEKHFSLKVAQNGYRMRTKILLMELRVIAESNRASEETLQGSSGNVEARQLIQPFKAIEELINDTDICLKNSELAFNIGDLETAVQHLGIAEEKFSQLKANLQFNTEREKRSSKTRKNVCIENSPSEILDNNVDIEDKTEDLKNEKHFSLKVAQNVYRMRAKILLMELQVIAESIRASEKTLQGSSGNVEARQLIQPFKAIEELINDTDICLNNSHLAFNIGDLEIPMQHLGIAEEKFSQLKANLQSNTEGEKRSSKTRKNVCIENSHSEILDTNEDIYYSKADHIFSRQYSLEGFRQTQAAKKPRISKKISNHHFGFNEEPSQPTTSEQKEGENILQAKICFDNALTAIINENYTKAMLQLSVSEHLDPNENKKKLLKHVRHKEAKMCFVNAQDAVSKGDLNKAELLLTRAEDLHSSLPALALLIEIRDSLSAPEQEKTMSSETNFRETYSFDYQKDSETTNKKEAEFCIFIAKNAFTAKNYTKAKELLLKAQRINPNVNITSFLSEIETASAGEIDCNKTLFNKLENYSETIEEANKEEAKRCVDIARTAFAEKNYDLAEGLLLKAQRKHPNLDVSAFLSDVRSARFTEIIRKEATLDTIIEANKKEAKRCIGVAKIAFADKKYDMAEGLLLKAQRKNPNVDVLHFLFKVRSARASRFPSNNNTSNSKISDETGAFQTRYGSKIYANNEDDAKKCIDVALRSFHAGDFDKSERFLLKAERLCPNTRAKDLLTNVLAAKASKHESKAKNTDNIAKADEEFKDYTAKKREVPLQNVCTEEQLQTMRRVNVADNDYDILGLSKEASCDDVKKTVKRLKKLLHPDKNPSPEAQKAFIAVTEAADRLKRVR